MNFNQFELGVMALSRREAPKLKEMIEEKSVHLKLFDETLYL